MKMFRFLSLIAMLMSLPLIAQEEDNEGRPPREGRPNDRNDDRSGESERQKPKKKKRKKKAQSGNEAEPKQDRPSQSE